MTPIKNQTGTAYRIKQNGKYVQTSSGKSVWTSLDAVKLALVNNFGHLYRSPMYIEKVQAIMKEKGIEIVPLVPQNQPL